MKFQDSIKVLIPNGRMKDEKIKFIFVALSNYRSTIGPFRENCNFLLSTDGQID
jgi:hypothetical protein